MAFVYQQTTSQNSATVQCTNFGSRYYVPLGIFPIGFEDHYKKKKSTSKLAKVKSKTFPLINYKLYTYNPIWKAILWNFPPFGKLDGFLCQHEDYREKACLLLFRDLSGHSQAPGHSSTATGNLHIQQACWFLPLLSP